MATLDELKEKNRLEAEAEAKAKKEAEDKKKLDDENSDDDDDSDDGEGDDDSNDDDSGSDDGDDGQGDDDGAGDDGEGSDDGEGDSEAWMKPEGDDDGEGEENNFNDGDMAKLRRKMQGKADKQKTESEEEINRLKAENEKLKNGQHTSDKLERPKRTDFKTDEEYEDALTDHRIDLRSAKDNANNATNSRKQQQQAKTEEIDKSVNDHYVRASALSEKSGIKPEAYQAADLRVRQAVEAVFPGGGDAVVDNLISVTGKGSEKVFFHLGVNPTKLAEFAKLFADGSGGLSAATYLGKLNSELGAPARRTSQAPAPGDDVSGDRSKADVKAKNFKKRYDAAHKSGEGTKAFNIKREAKKAKIDTSKWAQ